MKMITTSLVLALLSHFAHADTKTIGLTVSAAKDARHYTLKLVDSSCGKIENKASDDSDLIDVCVRPEGSDSRVEIDWYTRHAGNELHNRSVVIAARGEKFELDSGTAKLAVALQ